MSALLAFRNVGASYAGAVVLRDVSFTIGEGETVGLLGCNGAGKSTTLLSVFGVPKVSGQILFEDTPIGKRAYQPATRGVSLVPLGKRIFTNLTVEENVLLGRASGRKGSTWTLPKLYELFPNLARGAKRPGCALSGGGSRCSRSRALMADPRVLMLDEPTVGLAPVIIDELTAALEAIRATGTSLLLVEQHIGMIQKLASRFIALSKGALVVGGSIEKLQDREVQELIAL